MSRKCLVFVYGTLKPGFNPPRSLTRAWPDRIRAVLFDLGGEPSYPGITQVGMADSWVEGLTMEIDRDELPLLDEYEDVESGEFARRLVETEQGFTAWVYEYGMLLPESAKRVEKWPEAAG